MGALGISLMAALLVCVASTTAKTGSYALKMWHKGDHPLQEQLTSMYKDIEELRNDQALMKRNQEDILQVMSNCEQIQENPERAINVTVLQKGSSSTVSSLFSKDEGRDVEDVTDGGLDPCFHYTALDQTWRATNYTTKNVFCDTKMQWKGWYRLFYQGKPIQMPELCIKTERCGTHAPLWLVGGHPRIRQGIVTRNICGHWKNNCCAFKSPPILVKACKGNYYVYKFVKPTSCYLAYCADVNTLVCGRCKKNSICTSSDKINWFCRKNKKVMKVHFFASYPNSLSGKVNKVHFKKVYVNVGRAFNSRTGVFTAPVTGVYQFFFSTQSSTNGAKTDLWLVVNGYWVAVSRTHVGRSNSVGNLSTYMSTLRKGALVYVTHNCGNSWANSASNTITFGGSLLFSQRKIDLDI